MNINAKLHVKYDTQKVTDSFQKREFVVEYHENPQNPQYPQYLKFQLTQDKCSLLDSFEPGAMLDVSFNLRGREWTNPQGEKVFFNSLEAWRLTPVQANAGGEAAAPQFTAPQADNFPVEDDLPF